MKELLRTIMYIHSKNIIHRDLNLENILFLNEKEPIWPIITGFDLAFYQSETSEMLIYKVCGTPGFIAPEVL